jgi:hypothetical protein
MRSNLNRLLTGIVITGALTFAVCAQARVTTLDLINFVIKRGITEEVAKLTNGGQELCLLNGRQSYECSSYATIAQGICLAGNRPSYDCGPYVSLGQALCLTGGRASYDCSSYASVATGVCLSTGRPSYDCSSYVGLPQAVCLARGQPSYNCSSSISMEQAIKLPVLDISWAWDSFLDQNGGRRWACRGKNTGEFADETGCSSQTKTDTTWPGDRL